MYSCFVYAIYIEIHTQEKLSFSRITIVHSLKKAEAENHSDFQTVVSL